MMDAKLQEKIYRYMNASDTITDEEFSDIFNSFDERRIRQYTEYLRIASFKSDEWQTNDMHMYMACRLMRAQLSEHAAEALGYTPHPEVEFNHSTCCLIREAQGEEEGKKLAAEFDFPCQAPGCMWDNLAYRRQGDAIIALIGDDRGWDKDWMYWIVVEWQPQWLADIYGTEGWVS